MNISETLVTFSKNLTKKIDVDTLVSKSKKSGLKKTLTSVDLIILGISAIIGSGLFVMIGEAACGNIEHVGAGPALVISILLAAVSCIIPALCYAEFATMIPIAGSAYTYTFATMGEFPAWMMGWILMLEYAIGNITIATSWSEYLFQLLQGFEGILPHWITNPPIWLVNDYYSLSMKSEQVGENLLNQVPHIFGTPICINLPALFIILILGLVLYRGTKESTKIATLMVIIKLAVILLFVGVGAFYVKPENWVPFAPNGFNGILLGTFIIFYAYIGFDAISTAAEETRCPQKTLPIGLIGSLVICSIIYATVAIIFTGIIPFSQYGEINILAPIAHIISLIHQNWVAGWISLGALAGLTSVLLVYQFGTTRILYAMTRDKFFPQSMKKLHPKYKTPHIITWITTIGVMLGTMFINANIAAQLCIYGTFASFIIVCLGIIILKYTQPNKKRPFKVPFCPYLPILGILFCGYLMVKTAKDLETSSSLFLMWLAIGFVIYFLYGYRQNRKVEKGELIIEQETEDEAAITDVF